MKQGRASRDVRESTKVEPKALAINPRWTSQIGSAMGNHVTDMGKSLSRDKIVEKMHQGRGFNTPRDAGREVFPNGSNKRS